MGVDVIVTTVSVVVEAWYSSILVLGSNGVRSDSLLPSNGVRPDIAIVPLLINEQTEGTMNQKTCVYRQLMITVYMCLRWELKTGPRYGLDAIHTQ